MVDVLCPTKSFVDFCSLPKWDDSILGPWFWFHGKQEMWWVVFWNMHGFCLHFHFFNKRFKPQAWKTCKLWRLGSEVICSVRFHSPHGSYHRTGVYLRIVGVPSPESSNKPVKLARLTQVGFPPWLPILWFRAEWGDNELRTDETKAKHWGGMTSCISCKWDLGFWWLGLEFGDYPQKST